jgi:hypothetical protein
LNGKKTEKFISSQLKQIGHPNGPKKFFSSWPKIPFIPTIFLSSEHALKSSAMGSLEEESQLLVTVGGKFEFKSRGSRLKENMGCELSVREQVPLVMELAGPRRWVLCVENRPCRWHEQSSPQKISGCLAEAVEDASSLQTGDRRRFIIVLLLSFTIVISEIVIDECACVLRCC